MANNYFTTEDYNEYLHDILDKWRDFTETLRELQQTLEDVDADKFEAVTAQIDMEIRNLEAAYVDAQDSIDNSMDSALNDDYDEEDFEDAEDEDFTDDEEVREDDFEESLNEAKKKPINMDDKLCNLPKSVQLKILHAMEKKYPDEYTSDLWNQIHDVSPNSVIKTHKLKVDLDEGMDITRILFNLR